MLRESELRKIEGGLSRLLGAVFDQFVFNASAGIDFAGSGVFVLIGSEV